MMEISEVTGRFMQTFKVIILIRDVPMKFFYFLNSDLNLSFLILTLVSCLM